jgi:endonuclease III related protein
MRICEEPSLSAATAHKARPVRRGAEEQVRQIYRKLAQAWGPQHWWPAESPFEVIVGAILTQNTSWTNVERAMARLRENGELTLEQIRNIPLPELESLIRSSGYFRQKAQRLKDLVAFVDAKYGGSLEAMFATASDDLRSDLLTQKGIGMETADSILLYAGLHSVFVVDAYTRRIFERHQIVSATAKYDDVRFLVEGALAEEEVRGLANGDFGDPTHSKTGNVWGTRTNPTYSKTEDEWGTRADPTHSKTRNVWGTRTNLTDAKTRSVGGTREDPTYSETGNMWAARLESRPAVHPPSAMSTAPQSNLTRVYNEMHGLLVQVGKYYCDKRRPKCDACPLGELLSPRQRARLVAGRDVGRRGTGKAE